MHPLISAYATVLLSLPTLSAPPGVPPEVQIPFGCGLTFPVSQAHDVGSHTYNDVWAWDFRMPEGVPIVAAMDGTVRMARGDSSQGGCDAKFAPFANYVVIAHPNGYETQYLHFRQVVVKPGDKVKAGDLIGFSGSTGWACGSHLHFKVARPLTSGWNNPSVPARIAGYGDPQIDTLIVSPACKMPKMDVAQAGLPGTPVASAKSASSASAEGASSAAPDPASPATRAPATETPVPKPDSAPLAPVIPVKGTTGTTT